MSDNQSLNLAEAARRFLSSLSPEEAKSSQPEVQRFVRWYGREHSLAGLTAHEVANYAARMPSSDTDYLKKFEQIRAFLTYSKKQGWTKTNLAAHLKVKKGKDKTPAVGRQMEQAMSLTQQGYDDVKAELASLEPKRAYAIEEVRLAAADKDVRENAPLEAAREHHGQLVGRIKELEEILKSAVIIDEKQKTTFTVNIGNSVVLQDLSSKEELRYKIVSPREVDPVKGNISNVSPVGKAVMGRKEGDTVEVVIPAGKIRYQVKRVEP
ncbi:GreA/GreB family elongation factor [Chloroflexota bacterium]